MSFTKSGRGKRRPYMILERPMVISEEVRNGFHLFYDNFPFPVMLVAKDRTILAVNRTGATAGYPTGLRCCDLGKPEDHRACRAGEALRDRESKRLVMYYEPAKQVVDSYWIPLAGHDDLFVHYAADITEWASGRLFPKKHEGRNGCGCGGRE